MNVTDETGEYLVKLARHSAESWVKHGKEPSVMDPIPEQAKLTTGAFVTVKTYEGGETSLRGCIGYPLGIKALYLEIIDLSQESTLNDPRFHPVTEGEFSSLVFEVTILTPPIEIEYSDPQDLLNQIRVPGDGLIVKFGKYQGLLLPQVPVEQNWNSEEFLSYTCRKAYLPVDIWKKERVSVQKFQGIVFSEMKPKGKIKRLPLNN
ncbi:MAG: TIGR00296 family protein [Candidatus Heimdallarchaeota archaeon]|nr:TIGR00296 family protein [Candidatus Heimdallarchaeota archaeon]